MSGPTNPATLLAGLTVDALVAAGVGHVVLCPGSRSAPLAYRLARPSAGLRLHVRHDERVAAFTALGVGLRGTSIGAVVTTSGTAAANLHPAVLEAHHANRPMVVITADRPPAVRGTWVNQTSELQAGLFGAAVRARLDLADSDAATDPDAAWTALFATLTAARGRAAWERPGPVHLNLGFTEPLLPDDPSADPGAGRPWPSTVREPSTEPDLDLAPYALTVVLAGDGAGREARAFAESSGLPLLAEPSSGARGGPNAVGPYRLLLELPAFGDSVSRVVAFGRPTLSRPVTRLLARPEVEVVLVSPHAGWPDPGRPVVRCRQPVVEPGSDRRWLMRWRIAAASGRLAVDGVLDADAAAGRLTGPLLARELAAALRHREVLMAAASNPIRDLDLAAPAFRDPMPRVFANRGLSGIDGTVSTAVGIALAAADGDGDGSAGSAGSDGAGPGGGPHTRVLVGDVAFLHDLGALLSDPVVPPPNLQVVVLNDDGGGIFSLLEYGELAERDAGAEATFERVFGTPHEADLGSLCRGYGVPHRMLADVGELRAALATPAPGITVLEVRSTRAALRDLHSRIRTAVHAAAALTP